MGEEEGKRREGGREGGGDVMKTSHHTVLDSVPMQARYRYVYLVSLAGCIEKISNSPPESMFLRCCHALAAFSGS